MLLHVSIKTQQLTYSKGDLIQSKRVADGVEMTVGNHKELLSQCDKMLDITPDSFVFNYTTSGMRCASANRIAGASSRILNDSCNLAPYRFFTELFRRITGDRRITSVGFDDLQIPQGIAIKETIGH